MDQVLHSCLLVLNNSTAAELDVVDQDTSEPGRQLDLKELLVRKVGAKLLILVTLLEIWHGANNARDETDMSTI